MPFENIKGIDNPVGDRAAVQKAVSEAVGRQVAAGQAVDDARLRNIFNAVLNAREFVKNEIDVLYDRGFELSAQSVTIAEGGSQTISLKLLAAPTGNVTVTAVRVGDGSISVTPSSRTFSTSNWASAQNFTIAASQDGDAGDDQAYLTFTGSGGGYENIASSLQINVVDDD